MIKAVLLDFDGTVVTVDFLDILAGLNGKQEASEQINRDFHAGKLKKGLGGLSKRINLLSGLTLAQVESTISRDAHLMPGAVEFTDFLYANGIITILASGNILPVLEYFQRSILKLDYVVGSRATMRDGAVVGIKATDYPALDFKLFECRKILEGLGILASEALAIGDSPGEKGLFAFAHKSIAINPKGGIEALADYTIHGDLAKAIPIIEELNQ